MLPTRGRRHDILYYLCGVLGIGVVTRTPKIDRESQQNHNKTHNAIEHKKRVGPLSKSGVDFLWTTPDPLSRETTHNDSQRLTTVRPPEGIRGSSFFRRLTQKHTHNTHNARSHEKSSVGIIVSDIQEARPTCAY